MVICKHSSFPHFSDHVHSDIDVGSILLEVIVSSICITKSILYSRESQGVICDFITLRMTGLVLPIYRMGFGWFSMHVFATLHTLCVVSTEYRIATSRQNSHQ